MANLLAKMKVDSMNISSAAIMAESMADLKAKMIAD